MGSEPEQEPKLRVVDDESPTEEVLRLGDDGQQPKTAEWIPSMPVDEHAARLETGGLVDDADRRSIEPDIDAIIGPELDEVAREWAEPGPRKPVPYGWFLVILILIVGAVITSAVMISRSQDSEVETGMVEAAERLVEEEVEDEEAEMMVEAVEKTLERYVAASSIEDLLPLVRSPERVKPLMEEWYRERPFNPREYQGMGVFHPLDLEGRLFWLITCLIKGEPAESVLLEQTQDGRMLIDWETQVCYQPMPWDDFVRQRPEGKPMDFRVYAQLDPGGFYSHEFHDEDQWSVYRLTAKNAEEYLFGYARKGSETDQRLIELSQKNRGRLFPLLLKLNIPEGTTSPRGAVIEAITGERWSLVQPLAAGDAP